MLVTVRNRRGMVTGAEVHDGGPASLSKLLSEDSQRRQHGS
jgi:hypothetical protein